MSCRTGLGVDAHPLAYGRTLVLGGETIPYERGLKGDSDGDVLIHAVIDALLGASGLGDIGTHFPPGDPKYQGIASGELLAATMEMLRERRWRVGYLDATILAERPRVAPFMARIKENLAALLEIDPQSVNVKATTTDGLGFVGKGDGMAALALATIEPLQ